MIEKVKGNIRRRRSEKELLYTIRTKLGLSELSQDFRPADILGVPQAIKGFDKPDFHGVFSIYVATNAKACILLVHNQAHLPENAVRLQGMWRDSIGKIAPAKQQSAAGSKITV